MTGDRRGPGGHILTGPVYVEGALPGDVLEVKVLSIDLPLDYGYNGCAGFLPENCDKAVGQKIVTLNREAMTAEFFPGIVVPLKPFFGSMGVAPPPEVGRVSSNPPSRFAGNMDNKELVAGLDALHPGVRARRAVRRRRRPCRAGRRRSGPDGDRDVACAGGCSSPCARARRLNWPRAETATDYISMGADPDLTVATRIAIQEMVDFLARTRKLTTHQAYQLVSVAGNVAVTQLVDRPTMGVHVKMPKSIFK